MPCVSQKFSIWPSFGQSGKALGGHKRTHSTPPATNMHNYTSHSTTEHKQFSPPSRTVTLDLNVPAENANDCTQLQHNFAISVNLGAYSTSECDK